MNADKKIDITLGDLNEEVDEARENIKKKRSSLFLAECSLLAAKQKRAIHCSPFDEGEELSVSDEGEVTNIDGESFGRINSHHMLGRKLQVEKLAPLGEPPYYEVKVRKSVGAADRWSKTIYMMPYPYNVGYWKKRK